MKRQSASPWLLAVLIMILQLATLEVFKASRFSWIWNLLVIDFDVRSVLPVYFSVIANCLVAVTVAIFWRGLSKSHGIRGMSQSNVLSFVAVAIFISTLTLMPGLTGVTAVLVGSDSRAKEIVGLTIQAIGPWSAKWTAAYLIASASYEIWARGIVLTILAGRGALVSVLFSSMLFGLVPVANFLWGNATASATGTQIVQATFFGIGAGALRLRVGSLAWVIILHGLWNLLIEIGNQLFFRSPYLSSLDSVSMSTLDGLNWLPYLLFGAFGLVVLLTTKWTDFTNASISNLVPESVQD